MLGIGLVVVALLAPERRSWACGRIFLRGCGGSRLGAGASGSRQRICRAGSSFCCWCGRPTSAAILPAAASAAQSSGPGSVRKRPGRAPSAALRAVLLVAGRFAAVGRGKIGAATGFWGGSVCRFPAWRSLRIRGQAALRRQGFEPPHPRPWRAAGSTRRVRRSHCGGGDFRVFAGRRRWRRPRSYGLVRL